MRSANQAPTLRFEKLAQRQVMSGRSPDISLDGQYLTGIRRINAVALFVALVATHSPGYVSHELASPALTGKCPWVRVSGLSYKCPCRCGRYEN